MSCMYMYAFRLTNLDRQFVCLKYTLYLLSRRIWVGLDKNTPCHVDVRFGKNVLLLCCPSVLLTVDLFVVEKDTLGQTGTLEVVVSGTGASTAADGGPNLLTAVTTLRGKEGERERKRERREREREREREVKSIGLIIHSKMYRN